MLFTQKTQQFCYLHFALSGNSLKAFALYVLVEILESSMLHFLTSSPVGSCAEKLSLVMKGKHLPAHHSYPQHAT